MVFMFYGYIIYLWVILYVVFYVLFFVCKNDLFLGKKNNKGGKVVLFLLDNEEFGDFLFEVLIGCIGGCIGDWWYMNEYVIIC